MVIKELSDIVNFVSKNEEAIASIMPYAIVVSAIVGTSTFFYFFHRQESNVEKTAHERAKEVISKYLKVDKTKVRDNTDALHLLRTAQSLSDSCYLAKNYTAEWQEFVDNYNKSQDIKSALKAFLNKPRLRKHLLID